MVGQALPLVLCFALQARVATFQTWAANSWAQVAAGAMSKGKETYVMKY